MMKQAKPTPNATPVVTNNRFAQYPVIGSIVGLFSLNRRLIEAQQALRSSAADRRALIDTADAAIKMSERQINDSDALIAESQALRSKVK